MAIKVQLTADDYIAFQRLHVRKSLILWGIVALVLATAIVAVFIFVLPTGRSGGADLGLLPAVWIAVILIYVFRHAVAEPRNWRKLFAQSKELKLPFDVEISDDGITFTNELSTTRRPWDHFTKWKEDQRLILLYLTDNEAIMLPKRFLNGTDLERVYTEIRAHNLRSA